jgi:hypothetical protein
MPWVAGNANHAYRSTKDRLSSIATDDVTNAACCWCGMPRATFRRSELAGLAATDGYCAWQWLVLAPEEMPVAWCHGAPEPRLLIAYDH